VIIISILSLAVKPEEVNKNRRNTAIQLARMGFHLLPLEPKSKLPKADLLPGGKWTVYREHQASPEVVSSWFTSNPDINFGIIMGTPYNGGYLVAVDYDHIPKAMPITLTTKSFQGYHSIFIAKEIPGENYKVDGVGELIKNKYIVGAPSVHPEGINYEWSPFLSPFEIEPANFEDHWAEIRDNFAKLSSKTHLKDKDREHSRKEYPRININTGVLLQSPDLENLKKASGKEEIIFKSMGFLGVNVSKVGKSFHCPIHSEKTPSASLFRTDNGAICMQDFHRGGRFYTMPEVYFTWKTGKERNLKGAEALLWWIRFLRDSGAIERKKTLLTINNLPEQQAKVLRGFVELLDCRKVYDPHQKGTPFTRKFAADWCGVKETTAKKAINQLAKKGYITKISNMKNEGGKRQAGLWDLVRR